MGAKAPSLWLIYHELSSPFTNQRGHNNMVQSEHGEPRPKPAFLVIDQITMELLTPFNSGDENETKRTSSLVYNLKHYWLATVR